eukprot:scpid94504/ scgid15148/ S-phase kinase-associated protein 1; Cyclin-A/CDK2-associated protein p19; Organ of Corti protein 2; Organ of Corti protein II; RNA polymerase II elongation factor-like protein; SIII; Transcription elongation factor B; p19A; p19skp1 &gt; S-phase kinase-associated protein 1; Cyclin-A/CDK2-associated protein p19; Organ of Corti protein 2; Organ of Corti protein II; S-phase kinase-associated protein 1A; p19A; p19skp1 &gt; S-phase kinase-associated protein 1; Cyclin-A/CDK2-as
MASPIGLECTEGWVFAVGVKVAHQSETIKTKLEHGDTIVHLPNVNARTLRKIITWCEQHQNDTPVKEDDAMDTKERSTDKMDACGMEDLRVDLKPLVELILAAKYLQIKGLLHVTCKKFLNMTVEELANVNSIVLDVTAKQDAYTRDFNKLFMVDLIYTPRG